MQKKKYQITNKSKNNKYKWNLIIDYLKTNSLEIKYQLKYSTYVYQNWYRIAEFSQILIHWFVY